MGFFWHFTPQPTPLGHYAATKTQQAEAFGGGGWPWEEGHWHEARFRLQETGSRKRGGVERFTGGASIVCRSHTAVRFDAECGGGVEKGNRKPRVRRQRCCYWRVRCGIPPTPSSEREITKDGKRLATYRPSATGA